MNMNNFITKEINKDKLLNWNLEKIGKVNGAYFYEDPIWGDECPMLMITREGMAGRTDFWEMSDVYNAIENASE